jgi:hypothetical protein
LAFGPQLKSIRTIYFTPAISASHILATSEKKQKIELVAGAKIIVNRKHLSSGRGAFDTLVSSVRVMIHNDEMEGKYISD